MAAPQIDTDHSTNGLALVSALQSAPRSTHTMISTVDGEEMHVTLTLQPTDMIRIAINVLDRDGVIELGYLDRPARGDVATIGAWVDTIVSAYK